MILARTNIAEMPKSCTRCYILTATHPNGYAVYVCPATRKTVDDETIRPDWCPLVEAKKDEEQDGTIQSD